MKCVFQLKNATPLIVVETAQIGLMLLKLKRPGSVGGNMTVTLPAGITAIGADFLKFFGTGAYTITVNSASGPAQVFSLTAAARPAHTFGGFIAQDGIPITSLVISSNNASPTIDNVVIGHQTPEPSTFALFGVVASLGLCGYFYRRRVHAAA